MKHKTLRCTAETAALLLTVAMLAFLIAGLHQHDPDRVLSTLNTGWYQLTDGVRREIALPVTLPAEPGQTLTLYNDTLTHLLLAAGVAAMLTVLLRSYREQPSQQLRLRIAAFAALGVFGVAALVLYGLLQIYWYDAIFQFGVLLFIILLFRELLGQATEDMRFHMEHRISHQMQREDRMTGLPNRRAFEEYMERIRTGEVGCRDAVLTYIRLEGLNERNDRFGLQAGDEAVIAAARCVADFCRACEDGGESVSCFRTGGNEFALIRPEPRANSGQLHRQFSTIVARYNRTCAPRARITMTYGFSRLCDEDGKSRSISAWKAEADAYLKRNETRLGGDTE